MSDRNKPEWTEVTQEYDGENCGLTEFPNDILQKYRHARVVLLSGNRIRQLPETIRCFDRIVLLGLNGNRLSALPECIGELTTLRSLGVLGNPLRSLPSSLVNLVNLEEFYCDSIPGLLDRGVGIWEDKMKVRRLWMEIFPDMPDIDQSKPEKLKPKMTIGDDLSDEDDEVVERKMSVEIMERYPMGHTSKGQAIIINNNKFQTLPSRDGTEIDEKKIEDLFESLGLTVHIYRDMTADEITTALRCLSRQEHHKASCIAVCILSHGRGDEVVGVDGKSIHIEDITRCFKAAECPTLAGKPKLFFIQACQGRDATQPSRVEAGGSVAAIIPNEPDFCISLSTSGCGALRDAENGTFYITQIVDMLSTSSEERDFQHVLSEVHSQVAKRLGYTSCTPFFSSLVKKLYL